MARRAIEAFNRRDRDGFFGLVTDDVVMRTDPSWPGGGEFRGRSEFESFMDQFEESWGELAYETPGEPEAIGDILFWPSRWFVRGRSSGLETRLDFWCIFRFEEDRISRLDFFFDRAAADEFVSSLAPASE